MNKEKMEIDELIGEAMSFFDKEDYDKTVEFLNAALIASDLNRRMQIFEFINDAFLSPNRNEFEENYLRNRQAVYKDTKKGMFTYDKDKVPFHMIPVSDNRFYIWDSRSFCFLDILPIDFGNINNKKKADNFDSVLFIDITDIRRILKCLEEFDYSKVYIILSDDTKRWEFYSYFVMPDIFGNINSEVFIFSSCEELTDYLYESGSYIPRTILSDKNVTFRDLFEDLHLKRISEVKKKRPYLSISIPSRNRGEATLENVNHLRDLFFDEEIEIVVSNNGSTVGIDQYQKIAQIAKTDSRVVYGEFPPAPFSASIEQVLSISKGKYVLLCADEDRLYNDLLMEGINFIYQNKDKGGFLFRLKNEKNMILYDDYNTTNDIFDSLLSSFCVNYITGICYNNEIVRKERLTRKLHNKYVEENKNDYYASYPHNTHMAYLSRENGLAAKGPVLLFKYDEPDNISQIGYEKAKSDYAYLKLSTRLKHLDDQAEMLFDLDLSRDIFIGLLVELQERVYTLMYGAYHEHPEDMKNDQSWEECCRMIYDHSMEMWSGTKFNQICGDMVEKIRIVMKKYMEKHICDMPSTIE